MDGPRAPQDVELSQVFEFLDTQLRPKADWSIKQEYPTALTKENSGNIRIIKSNDKIIAHAVVHYSLTKTAAGIFKVAAIGSVVTDPEFRNQGLSRQVIESCLKTAELHGCDFAVLWTNLYDFYRKFEFELAGSEVALVIEKEFSPPNENLRIMETTKVAAEALLRVYSQHTVGAIRIAEDFRKYLAIPNTKLYTAWDAHNNLKAYAVEGKGVDLVGYIHEWGGSVSSLLPLLAHVRRQAKTPITIIASGRATNLSRQLVEYGALKNEGFLGMIKILNPKNLCFKLMRYARALGKEDWVFDYSEGLYYIGTSKGLFKTDSPKDVVKLVFGPLKAHEIKGFDEETTKVMEEVLPIPFWIWGWDSI
ncbi:MAG: GNAT family N-acetyltransferase [Bdellovibrionaceae bacterium]|nr:GNAT family N-acetyltransferase [Bdellovibrionales bacterium]MCB9084922.1 GNAT family N-acetyltransferase [Pseudobdellovibrionaceae bacterium]